MIYPIEVDPKRVWFERALYALLIGGVTLSLLIAFSAVFHAYFNRPPIVVRSLDPPDLGKVCPGHEMLIHNDISINDDIIVFYYISTMDANANSNYPSTQRAYVDFLHPHPAKFQQELAWKVPDLPPGRYTRVFGVRNVGADQDVIFLTATYEIKDKGVCPDVKH